MFSLHPRLLKLYPKPSEKAREAVCLLLAAIISSKELRRGQAFPVGDSGGHLTSSYPMLSKSRYQFPLALVDALDQRNFTSGSA
jgi:hypothetical protein